MKGLIVRGAWIGAVSLLIAACGGGGGSETAGALPPTTVPPNNSSPTIGGSPATSVAAGEFFSFVPSANDPDGDALTFSISNPPTWAQFSINTGALTGTPGNLDVGTTAGIVITASDGSATAALQAFSVQVQSAGNGVATLSWMPPTLLTNGDPLLSLSGYKIYYGTSDGNFTEVVDLPNPGLTMYTVANLAPSTYYFALTAYDGLGVESDKSNSASKTIF